MKNKTFKITSLSTGRALLIILEAGRKIKSLRFATIDETIEFVIPLGNRKSALWLNGFDVTPYAWVA